MSYHKKLRRKTALGAGLFCLLLPAAALAGAYLLSAHGSSSIGVARPAMTSAGYGQGNCAHCHGMHDSLGGVEPAPAGGAPSPYTLFAGSSNPTIRPYDVTSNFCFNCHSGTGSAQQVTNYDYSQRFGGGDSTGPQDIMAAFNLNPNNQGSYHNLGDIKTFVGNNSGTYPWFSSSYSNPCDGCHNPHLAKRNWVAIPSNSAISKPSGVNHFSLWGEASPQLMSAYSYEAPYSTFQTTYVAAYREPNAGSTTDGSITPDYAGFCTDCHNSTNTITSTSLGTLKKIDWSAAGDKHGGYARDYNGTTPPNNFRNPYAGIASSKANLVLSCLDCHEPHGSPNIMLLRRRINGENVGTDGLVTTGNAESMGYVCRRCHMDDAIAYQAIPTISFWGTHALNNWEYVHHLTTDHPYVQSQCGSCHPGGGAPPGSDPSPIPCGNCHGHGMSKQPTTSPTTIRKTF